MASEGSAASKPQRATPELIRINSKLLLDTLSKITGFGFTDSDSPANLELRTQVMLRPFKLLATYEQEIRAYTQALDEH